MSDHKVILNMTKEEFANRVQKEFNTYYTEEEYNKMTLEEKQRFIENIISKIDFENQLKLIIHELDKICEKYVIKHDYKNRLLNLEEVDLDDNE